MRKVIDAFMFFNELDVMEIRLNELYPVVDHFVIAESTERHGSPSPKPLYLKDNWERFKQFEDKIVYVQSPKFPKFHDDEASRWARENFHRNSLMAGIQSVSLSTDDLVILSDCDEIPRATIVESHRSLGDMKRLGLDMFYYNVNRYVQPWACSTIGPLYAYHAEGGLQAVRSACHRLFKWDVIPDAGWHFSFFGDVYRLREKAESFAEARLWGRALWNRSDSQIAEDILNGKDILQREFYRNQTFTHRESNDPRLPKYFLGHIDRYAPFTKEGFK